MVRLEMQRVALIGATLGWADFCIQVDKSCLRISPELLRQETGGYGTSKLCSIFGLDFEN